jgi:hypothetical protein
MVLVLSSGLTRIGRRENPSRKELPVKTKGKELKFVVVHPYVRVVRGKPIRVRKHDRSAPVPRN